MFEVVPYGGWSRCLRLFTREIELIVTAEVGPRVIRCGFIGERNLFHEVREDLGRAGGDRWRLYGGHRFWHAPEAIPRTYSPDNSPVAYEHEDRTVRLTQGVEPATGLQKAIAITLTGESEVQIAHTLTNHSLWAIEAAPWALSVMAAGTRAILPQEPHRSQSEDVLPARPLVLWSYTDMTDSRWTWGSRYIQVQQDPAASGPQKIGCRNSLGWLAGALDDTVFVKRFECLEGATYPDMGCNAEIYTDSAFLELESLGPLTRLEPGASVTHTERWSLHHLALSKAESSIDEALLPLIG